MPGRRRPPGTGEPLRAQAWAKLNLSLQVTARRADGYHELDSLIVFAGLADELELVPAEELSLTVEGPFAAALGGPGPAGGDNLVLRAAAALRRQARVAAGARLRLVKRLPVAAGLGGGSADAAAALRGLCRLWDLPGGAAAALAAGLGADVPVCLSAPRPAWVGGIGERVSLLPALPPAWLVLANPGIPLATAAVFAARRGPFSAPGSWQGPPPRDAAALAERLGRYRNDLEPAARRLLPAIGSLLEALRASEACLLARMSGSGATCFGLYAERGAALAAAEALAARHPSWWLVAAPMLTGAETAAP